jgi:hypothetical protein
MLVKKTISTSLGIKIFSLMSLTYQSIVEAFISEKGFRYQEQKTVVTEPKELEDAWLFTLRLEPQQLQEKAKGKLFEGKILVDKQDFFCLYLGNNDTDIFEKQLGFYRNYIRKFRLFDPHIPYQNFAKWDDQHLADKFGALKLLLFSQLNLNALLKLLDLATYFYNNGLDDIFDSIIFLLKEGMELFGEEKKFLDKIFYVDAVYKLKGSSLEEEIRKI